MLNGILLSIGLGLLLAALALGTVAGFLLRRPAPQLNSIRTVINPPDKMTLNLSGDAAGPPVLSPDGTSIAFTASTPAGKTTLWVRPANSLEARELSGNAPTQNEGMTVGI